MRLFAFVSILALTACGGGDTPADDAPDTDTDTADDTGDAPEVDPCDVRPNYASCTAEGPIDFGFGSGTIALTWDSEGNLAERVVTANGQRREVYEYDDAGRLTRQTNTTGSNTETLDYTYDEDGNQTSVTSSQGAVQRWTYDDEGHLLTQTWDYDGDGTPEESCDYTWPAEAAWDYEEVCGALTTRVVLHQPSGKIASRTQVDNTSGQTVWTESWTYREDCQPEYQSGEFDSEQGLNQFRTEFAYDEAGRRTMQNSETEGPNPRRYVEELTYTCGG